MVDQQAKTALKGTSKPTLSKIEILPNNQPGFWETCAIKVDNVKVERLCWHVYPPNFLTDCVNDRLILLPKFSLAATMQKKITLGWIKVMQFGTHGITPHFKSLLKLYIKNSDMIAFSFNEGLSGIMQTCIMGIIIQKWDCAEKCMRVCYWSSSFFGHAYWSTQTLDWGWQGFQS